MTQRLLEIVEAMRIRATDRVLEIGCGHGVAATYVCKQLGSGQLLAIDRSSKMITAATIRNQEYVRAGKAEFVLADASTFDPGVRRFDKIFGVRVALLLQSEARNRIERWLKPRGEIFVFYDEPRRR